MRHGTEQHVTAPHVAGYGAVLCREAPDPVRKILLTHLLRGHLLRQRTSGAGLSAGRGAAAITKQTCVKPLSERKISVIH